MNNTEQPSIFTGLRQPISPDAPMFEDGDVALIIKASGEIRAVSVGIDAASLDKPLAEMSEKEQQMFQQGQTLLALVTVVSSPQLMSVATDVAAGVFSEEKLRELSRAQ